MDIENIERNTHKTQEILTLYHSSGLISSDSARAQIKHQYKSIPSEIIRQVNELIKAKCNAEGDEITYDVDNKELAIQLFDTLKHAGYKVNMIHPDHTFTLRISW